MASLLSIRSKLLVLLMISGLSAALAISTIGYMRSDTALRAAVWDQLVSIRETKKADIVRYLDAQERAFAAFAKQDQVADAIVAGDPDTRAARLPNSFARGEGVAAGLSWVGERATLAPDTARRASYVATFEVLPRWDLATI